MKKTKKVGKWKDFAIFKAENAKIGLIIAG